MTDVIIFSGQSNMQGQADELTENNVVQNACEYKYLIDELLPLCNPVGENIRYDRKIGYDLKSVTKEMLDAWIKDHAFGGAYKGNTNLVPTFCREYSKCVNGSIVAVHAAKGSTSIREWTKGEKIYNMLCEKVNSAVTKVGKENIDKVFFVWLQGESDAIHGMSKEEYLQRLIYLKNDLKKDLSIYKFGIIKVGRFTGDVRDENIMQAQERACERDSDFVMLTRVTQELTADKEYMSKTFSGHYNAKGLEIIGESAGATLAKIKNKRG